MNYGGIFVWMDVVKVRRVGGEIKKGGVNHGSWEIENGGSRWKAMKIESE